MVTLKTILSGIQPEAAQSIPELPLFWQEIAFSEAAIDSREVILHALFVALSGERTDGHNFLIDAAERGARGALVRKDALQARWHELSHYTATHPKCLWVVIDATALDTHGTLVEETIEQAQTIDLQQPLGAIPFLLICVDDPLLALQHLALFHRNQLKVTVVGITGSVGKTSTKEILAAMLNRRFVTLKSKRSYNSDASVPTVLLQLTPAHQVAVLELGMWAAGEIRRLAALCSPQIGIVTNIGPSHLERMGSIEAIAEAKAELVEVLPPDGLAILNADDPYVATMAKRTSASVLTYGLSPTADLWADQIESEGLSGIAFSAHYRGETVHVSVPFLGRHSVHTALAAAAVGLHLGMRWDEIIAGFQDRTTQVRLLVVPGIAKSQIIDDTYNASPSSSLAALNLLAELDGLRIAVLGDMLELGSIEEEAHRLVGRRVAEVAHHLVTVGQRARWIADEARVCGMSAQNIIQTTTNHEAITHLQTLLAEDAPTVPAPQPPDTNRQVYILVKGSRGVAMEQIVAALQRRTE